MAKYTSDDIVQQFIRTHGGTYDYSLVDYVHSQTKVKIICRAHGVFEQLVGAHRRGQGCAKCMYDDKRSSLLEVIAKFKEVHGERYDYSRVEYKNADTKVVIECIEHGEFRQTPYHHSSGDGCPRCAGKNRTLDDVLASFKLVHGDRYDYSKVTLASSSDKVDIICKKHGEFKQRIGGHASGKGCIRCAGIYQYTTDEIIERFTEVHGNLYDYSFVNYINSDTKIKIVCENHGVFEQMPHSHMTGCGCPSCASSYQPSTSEVIDGFKDVHLDRYDYSRVEYQSAFVEVEIICDTHGSFMQTARSHKRGSGCPDCAVTIGHTKNSYLNYCNQFDGNTRLYVIRCQCDNTNETFYKVGIARQGAKNRFNSYGKLPYSYETLKEIRGNASLIWDLEDEVHEMLHPYRYKPSKDFHGKTECFMQITKEAMDLIDSHTTEQAECDAKLADTCD